jgi:hypothetical protein
MAGAKGAVSIETIIFEPPLIAAREWSCGHRDPLIPNFAKVLAETGWMLESDH